jgi:hypothetical protein
MPPHLGAARRNAASGTPQIPDHRQRARLATEMLAHAASLETAHQSPDALATEMLPHGASLETVRQSPDASATEMLAHAASLETAPSQQARGASSSAMRPRLAPATLRERRHPVRQLFVAVEMVKG